jgi:hypothetical protein
MPGVGFFILAGIGGALLCWPTFPHSRFTGQALPEKSRQVPLCGTHCKRAPGGMDCC